jgi:glucose-1-phosphate thymidylyltransferase
MKGVLLAGGNGRRLNPLTDITNKHLLPVYNKPMILYPLRTLLDAGINEIVIVTGREYAGGFLKLLGSGRDYGCRLWYEIQDEAGGIAQALGLSEKFAGGENIAVILGDNIFEDNFRKQAENFEDQKGARVFLKRTAEAGRFGVAEVDGDQIIRIEEKPANPKTDLAVTGLYFYDNDVFKVIQSLKPSLRGELEITDVNNEYIRQGKMKANYIEGSWTDAGTFESLYRANQVARKIELLKSGFTHGEILQRDREMLE